jgi:hypothetical protein
MRDSPGRLSVGEGDDVVCGRRRERSRSGLRVGCRGVGGAFDEVLGSGGVVLIRFFSAAAEVHVEILVDLLGRAAAAEVHVHVLRHAPFGRGRARATGQPAHSLAD